MESVRGKLEPAMDVYGSDEEFVGEIKELHETDFLVDRPMQRDIYVPYTAVQGVYIDYVLLTTPVDQIDRMGWPTTATENRHNGKA